MKCTECPELGHRIDYTTFVCNYTGGFLSLDDLDDPHVICARDPHANRKKYERPVVDATPPKTNKKDQSKAIICKTCKLEFSSKKEFKLHTKREHPYICDNCGQGLNSLRSLGQHRRYCKKTEVAS